jgi:prophage antirepressor-like protein
MNALTPTTQPPAPFTFEGSHFRWVLKYGEPWFVGTDLAGFLGYRDAGNMLRNLDEDEKGTHNLSTALNELRVGIVSEPGLYHAIDARRQVKKLPVEVQDRIVRFQRWVNHEVLPSIRRTGSYTLPTAPQPVDPLALLEGPTVLRGLLGKFTERVIVAEQRAEVAEAAVEASRPAVEFVEALADSDGLWGLKAAGKALHQGPLKFVAWLKERGDLYDLNGGPVANERCVKRGLFQVA